MVAIKKESYDKDVVCCESDEDHYPWGTELEFRDEVVEALNVDDLAAGDEVMVTARAFISRKGKNTEDKKGTGEEISQSLSLQITEISVSKADVDNAVKLYG